MGGAIRALPLAPFLRKGTINVKTVCIARDWQSASQVMLPLREIPEARVGALYLPEGALLFDDSHYYDGFIRGDEQQISWSKKLRQSLSIFQVRCTSVLQWVKGKSADDVLHAAPFPTWDDHAPLPTPLNDVTRRLPEKRVDRLLDGSLLEVKRTSRRPLKDRERMLEQWKTWHSEGITLGEARRRAEWVFPPLPKHVRELAQVPHIALAAIPDSNVIPGSLESKLYQSSVREYSDDLVGQVQFQDAPK
eukprot:2134270-Amphidinium_carterae.1